MRSQPPSLLLLILVAFGRSVFGCKEVIDSAVKDVVMLRIRVICLLDVRADSDGRGATAVGCSK